MASDLEPQGWIREDDEGLFLVCREFYSDESGRWTCEGRKRLDDDGERWVCPDCGSTTRMVRDQGDDLPYGVTDDD